MRAPPSEELQALIAQFSEFVVKKDISSLEWKNMFMRSGRWVHPQMSPPNSARPNSLKELDDPEQIDDMMSFLLEVYHHDGEDEVIDFMNELYWRVNGAKKDEIRDIHY